MFGTDFLVRCKKISGSKGFASINEWPTFLLAAFYGGGHLSAFVTIWASQGTSWHNPSFIFRRACRGIAFHLNFISVKDPVCFEYNYFLGNSLIFNGSST